MVEREPRTLTEMCGTCRYFIQTDADHEEADLGYCRRYPPTTSPRVFDPPLAQLGEPMLNPSVAAYPLVVLGAWCGEWQQGHWRQTS